MKLTMNKIKCLIIILISFTFLNLVLFLSNGYSNNSNSNDLVSKEGSSESLTKLLTENIKLKKKLEELQSKIKTPQEPKTSKSEDYEDRKKDMEYKLLWEVTEVFGLNNNMFTDMETAKKLIGTEIEYNKEIIRVNGVEVLKNPGYHFAIIPIIPYTYQQYIGRMPSLGEISITGNYFVYVYIHEMFLVKQVIIWEQNFTSKMITHLLCFIRMYTTN